MAEPEEFEFSLKVMMFKERNKVLYAAVDSDFADVLLSFLTLPLGTIVRLLNKHYGDKAPILGSLNSLYACLQNMDDTHFWAEAGKLMLLNPRNSSEIECSRLKLQIDDTSPTRYFICPKWNCVSMYYQMRCLCPDSTYTDITKNVLEIGAPSGGKSGVFTAQTSSFILTDDMEILTNSPASILRILKLNGVKDTSALQERTLNVGLKEIMELLKGSLVSKTPLSDIVFSVSSVAATLHETKRFFAPVKCESDALLRDQTIQNSGSDSKKITLKVFVQKSTNRFLLAQARNDFVDFLFSLLIIPLGRLQFILGNNSYLGSIKSLYTSISNLEIVECMKSKEAITRLLEPQIPPYYLSCFQIFSLDQQRYPIINRNKNNRRSFKLLGSTSSGFGCVQMAMIDPKGQNSFIKGPTLFIVSDDLVVSTAASASIISTLDRMKIPISDVEEQEIGIGMEEALSILKASISSTRALSDGLKPFLMKQPKQEK
ncbi:uncharacterized protein [Henckelia pumila]|uniref:uncharacterized protein n=1 Tax=Henckelia pumila TaxID=405737 RepID=UPI003C6E6779